MISRSRQVINLINERKPNDPYTYIYRFTIYVSKKGRKNEKMHK